MPIWYFVDNAHPRIIKEYLHNMGFPQTTDNFLFATERHTDKAYSKLVKVFHLNCWESYYILVFENDGLLMLGLKRYVDDNSNVAPNSSQRTTDYLFSGRNGFIPRASVTNLKLNTIGVSKELSIFTDERNVNFNIPTMWGVRLFQMKNVRNLNDLIKQSLSNI